MDSETKVRESPTKVKDSRTNERFDDTHMELVMGHLLQVGVLTAASVVLIGGVLYVIGHSGEATNLRVFRPRPIDITRPQELLRRLRSGDARAIVQTGLLLLIATPVCRVIFAAVAFVLQKDWLYIAVSVTVLAVLLFGIFRGG